MLKTSGFTLIELVVVISVMALLAVLVVSRGVTDYQAPIAAQKLASDIEYAQALAVSTATRCGVDFSVASNRYTVFSGTPATPVSDPVNGGNYTVQYGSGNYSEVTLSSVSFNATTTLYFDSRGRPLDSSGNLLTSDGTAVLNGPRTVTVTQDTGVVRVS
ncbi:MAG: GspH/FimT family pseudopilin [Chlamydiae bacterium]|nr:GspH/FimT family pseudopilin [Chlamydiota bacterium]MBI3266595.1 GspH/FimT family pseudopilin [Chlamydiota bacterium]